MKNKNAFTLVELPVRRGGSKRAFTLVELLVVVAIIVILLALLTPAMDRAIYQAEMARCATQHKGIASGAAIYAVDFKQFYPDRPVVNGGWLTTDIIFTDTTGIRYDDRSVIKNHIPINLAVDPLVRKVDLASSTATRVQSSFASLWFGSRYVGHKGMRKFGDRFAWTVAGVTPKLSHFNLLSSDSDYFTDQNGGAAYSSHVDDRGVLSNSWADQPDFSVSYWAGPATRGRVDFNYAFADGSVVRLDGVKTNKTADEADDRVVAVPILYNATSSATWYQQVPKP